MSKEKLNQALITAVIINDIERVQSLIKQGADVNYQYEFGSAPLHFVRSPQIAQILINNGANVNQGDNIGLTPLHYTENKEIAQLLLMHGANVNQKADDGRTPLFFAKNPQIAQILIKNGANVNHKDNYGNTPLHYVTDIKIARLLVASGADINHQNQAGLTPVTRIQDVRLQAFLITNGANFSAHKNPENQIHNRHPNTLQTPTGPEYGHSASPVPDSEIRDFVNNDLKIEPVTDESKETMFKALKEVCRTPTGCMAFRATRANVKAQRKKNTNYHLDVTLSKDADVDYYGCVFGSKPNRIYIQTQKIQNSYTDDTGEADFQIGSTFLHEAMHVRQNQNPRLRREPNSTITDAPTSALTRQLALESPYKDIRRREDISDSERLSYEWAVRLNKDGSYNAVAAQRYSAHMQQIYTREFVRKPEERPIVNYGSLSRKYAYLDTDIHTHLLLDWERSPSDESYADLEQRFHIHPDKKDFVKNQVTNALKPYAEKVKKCCSSFKSFKQRKALRDAVINGNTSLSPELFPKGSEEREAAEAYLNASNDIRHQLILISIYSPKIQDDPDNIYLLQQTATCRRILKEKYNIIIPTHNLSGERVTENMDIETGMPSSTLDAILRQSEQNAVCIDTEPKNNPPHDMTNATLASNSTHNSGTIEIDNQSSATKNHMTDKNLV